MTPVPTAGWDVGERLPVPARASDPLTGVAAVGAFIAVALTPWFYFPGILGAGGLAFYAFFRFLSRASEARREVVVEAFGPEAVPANLTVLARGILLGEDEGVIFPVGGLVAFVGRRTSFAVRPDRWRRTPGGSSLVYEDDVEARLSFSSQGDRLFAPSGVPEPGAVEMDPPAVPTPGWIVPPSPGSGVCVSLAALTAVVGGTPWLVGAFSVAALALFAAPLLRAARRRGRLR